MNVAFVNAVTGIRHVAALGAADMLAGSASERGVAAVACRFATLNARELNSSRLVHIPHMLGGRS
jgi:hypothetical protein